MMAELKTLSLHRPMPSHIQGIIEGRAWGDLIRAFDAGLPVNLMYEHDQTLFGSVCYVLAEDGPEDYSHAAWGPVSIVENFVKRGLSHCPLPHVPAVISAAASGQWSWVQMLLAEGYPIESKGSRPIFHAIAEGRLARRLRGQEEHWEAMEDGVRFFPFNKDAMAETKEMGKCFCLLVENGADMEALEADDDDIPPISALTLAVMYNDVAMVRALLCAGAGVHFDPGDDANAINSMHPLSVAAKEGLAEVLGVLLENSGLDVLGHHGVDAMHVAASCGHIDCAEILLANGIDATVPTRMGQFHPLHQAALHGRGEMIDWLLSHGASWDAGGDFSASSVLRSHHPALARSYRLSNDGSNVIPLRPSRSRVAK